jgi:putative acetyltransferase
LICKEIELNIIIRNEQKSDYEAISEITLAAFANEPHSNQTEPFIIKALRKAGALTVSLVAELDGKVVGHIAFSTVTIDGKNCDWYGLGPISVSPQYQRQGIGTSLMHEGIRLLKELGAKGCALVGDPEYYKRFGFKNIPELILEGVPPENFLALSFGENNIQGAVAFHEAFTSTN